MEDICPTNDYIEGIPSGECWSTGHYMCDSCIHLKKEFLNKETLHNAIAFQGGINIITVKK